MEYTINYHLPQWAESDRIMMGDFNQMCSSIDQGLTTAQSSADKAYSPEKKPYAVGSYTGNHGIKTINLGFHPSFLIITGDESSNTSSGHYATLGSSFGIITDNHNYGTVTLTDTGFSVARVSDNYPRLNESSSQYVYIAFR